MTATQMEEVAVRNVPSWRADRESRPRRLRLYLLAGAVAAPFAHFEAARAQVPQWVTPKVEEMGIGSYTAPTGSSGSGGLSGSGSSGGTGSSTSSDSLDEMMATSWGAQAAQESASLGVNSSALAATCEIESQCTNTSGTGSITGAFQMTNSTFQAMYQQALADDPSLAATTSDDANDPASEAAAAAEYLKQAANSLEANGVSDPTALQARGYYNFGPAGAALATANQDATVQSVLPNVSATTLAKNGVTAGETVAQWNAAVSAKMGSGASAPVLT